MSNVEINWVDGSALQHFQRAIVAVCFFIFSPVLALLFQNGFLYLARSFGLQRWVPITEILRRYEHYHKVVMNTKLVIKKKSDDVVDDDVDDEDPDLGDDLGTSINKMRNVHFFSDSTSSLLKLQKTHRISNHDIKRKELKNKQKYIVCPPSIELHAADNILPGTTVENVLFDRHSRTKRMKKNVERKKASESIQNEDFVFKLHMDGDDVVHSVWNDNGASDILEQMRIEKKFESEMRPLGRYLRGNFVTLIASIIAFVILSLGWITGLATLGVSFTETISGSTFLLGVTLFKLADNMKGFVSYFNMLLTDPFERGDIVEIYGPYGFSGGSVCGCVYDITPSAVRLLTFKPYQLLPVSSSRLDLAINRITQQQTEILLEQKTERKKQEPGVLKSNIVDFDHEYTKNQPISSSSNSNSNFNHNPDHVRYIEKPQRVIAYFVNVPNSLLLDAITNRNIFWEKKVVCFPIPREEGKADRGVSTTKQKKK